MGNTNLGTPVNTLRFPEGFIASELPPVAAGRKVTVFGMNIGRCAEIDILNNTISEREAPPKSLDSDEITISRETAVLPGNSPLIDTFLSPYMFIGGDQTTLIVPGDSETIPSFRNLADIRSAISFDEDSVLSIQDSKIQRINTRTGAIVQEMAIKRSCRLLSNKGSNLLVGKPNSVELIEFPTNKLIHQFNRAVTGVCADDYLVIVYLDHVEVYRYDH